MVIKWGDPSPHKLFLRHALAKRLVRYTHKVHSEKCLSETASNRTSRVKVAFAKLEKIATVGEDTEKRKTCPQPQGRLRYWAPCSLIPKNRDTGLPRVKTWCTNKEEGRKRAQLAFTAKLPYLQKLK